MRRTKNSIIAQGCVINGEVENCVISKGVYIGEGAKRSVSVALDALNALIKKYGYPDDVVVEMPRDKNEDEQKDRIKKFQKNRENELKEIKNKLKQEYNIELTDEYFRKHSQVLWEFLLSVRGCNCSL